jgi:hypothetical protein
MTSRELKTLFGIPAACVSDFIEKCRTAHISLNPDHERWLKAWLVMRSCAQGIRPFVSHVMGVLHRRVVDEVRETVTVCKGNADDDDWKFPSDSDENKNPEFDFRPSVLKIVSLDDSGAAVANESHRLSPATSERFMLSRADFAIFVNDHEISNSSNLVMRTHSTYRRGSLHTLRQCVARGNNLAVGRIERCDAKCHNGVDGESAFGRHAVILQQLYDDLQARQHGPPRALRLERLEQLVGNCSQSVRNRNRVAEGE